MKTWLISFSLLLIQNDRISAHSMKRHTWENIEAYLTNLSLEKSL